MSIVDKTLSETFGVETLESQTTSLVVQEENNLSVVETPDTESMDRDIEFVRGNLHSLLQKGSSAFDFLVDLAKAEERTAAFEVANSMMANLSTMSMMLLKVHEQKKKLKSESSKSSGGVTINATGNVAFVGTTKELMDSMKSDVIDLED